MAKIIAVCISKKKGTSKKNVKKGKLRKNHGLVGDAHAGPGLRQVSLLAKESLDKIKKRGLKLGCGGFGENLATAGLELTSFVVGTKLKVGKAVLEVTKIGKDCKKPCAIYKKLGSCILPSQGIFTHVLKGGDIAIGDTVEAIPEKRILAGVLIVSDRSAAGKKEDVSGRVLMDTLGDIGAQPVRYKIVPDERKTVSSVLKKWADEKQLDLIITSGGTGFSSRDVTPEATGDVLEREAPGLAEMMRAKSSAKADFAYLSRGVAGIRGGTLIINFPGSPKAVRECLEIISPVIGHAIEIMKDKVKDCGKRLSR